MVLAASELCSENAFPRTVAAIRRVALITAQRASRRGSAPHFAWATRLLRPTP